MTTSKFKISNRVLSVLLCLALLLSYLPLSPLTMVAAAATATTERNIMLGTSDLKDAQASNVYFGSYQQSSNGSGGYNIDPIKWRVLSNADGKLFLLSDQNLDVFRYHLDYDDVTWKGSTMRSWLNGYGASDNLYNTDYTSNNFIDAAFSENELAAIADTTVVNDDNPQYGIDGGDSTTDKVFLLSIQEALNTAYGFTDNKYETDKRVATNTAYAAYGGEINDPLEGDPGEADYWWLRSPGKYSSYAAEVGDGGYVYTDGSMVIHLNSGVRPAININLSSVVLTSAAVDGKPEAFSAVGDSNGTDWKLTLLDSSHSTFNATLSSLSNNTVTVSYSGATTGDNEYISAIIKNKNDSTVKYYGRLALAAESGTVTVTLPADFNAVNGDVLCIFNEQYNGNYETDYASELKEMPIYGVAFDANGGTGTMNAVALLKNDICTLPANGFTTPSGYKFSGWATTADGTVISNTTITVTDNTTLYAIWEALPAEAPTVMAGSNLTLTYKDHTNQQVSVSVTEKTGYTYSYQWYDGNDQPISEADDSAYTVPTDLTAGSHSYYCRVTAKRIDNGLTNSADSAAITVTVNKATPGVTAPTAKENLVFNGSEQELIDAGSATNGTMQYALGTSNSTAPTDGWSTDIPKARNADTYYVWYRVVGNDNYNDVEPVCITVTVNRATATLAAPTAQNSITYGAKLSTVGLTDGWTWADGNIVPTVINNGYTAYYTPADTANYDWTQVAGWNGTAGRVERTVSVTVNKATPGVTAPTAKENLVFNGSEQELIDAGSATNGTMQYALGTSNTTAPADGWSTDIPAAENADTYYVWYRVVGNTNYSDVEPVCITVTVAKLTQHEPLGIVGVAETIYGKNDGEITGVVGLMEYRKTTDAEYEPITGTKITGLAAGTYQVRFKETDNHLASLPITVTIAAGSKLEVTVPQDQTGYTLTVNETELGWHGSTTLVFALADGYSKTDEFSVSATGATLTDNGDGTYTISNAVDNVTVTVQGVADTTAPEAEISISTNKWTQFLNTITFGLFFNETETVTITATDEGSSVDKIYYLISETELTEDEVKALASDKWTEYDAANKPSIDPDNKYIVYAKVTDTAQNVKYISSDGLVFDGTAPVIIDIENGKTYYGQVVFGVTDGLAGIESVEIDGVDKTHFEGQYVINPDNKEHTIVATDRAGNTTTYTISVMKKYTVTFMVDGEVLTTKTVNHNADAEMPEIPAKTGYTHVWDKDGKAITADTTITAVYTVIKFTGTENTEKVKDITPENVKPEDKTDLEKAKEDLEDALEDNYTEDEKENIQEEIDRINEALDVIDRVEKVEQQIENLPDTITKDDIDDVEAAKKAYDELSDYEKTLVDPELKEKLDAALDVIDRVEKVEELIVNLPDTITKDDIDDVEAAKKAYDELSDYEKTLVDPELKEKLDAAIKAAEDVNKPADTNSPQTGDNTNLWLWIALLFVSGGAVITLTVYDRKRRTVNR